MTTVHPVFEPILVAISPSVPRAQKFDPVAAVQSLGRRATRACDLTAAGGEWTPRTLSLAAQGLDSGSRSVGVSRRWPRLATSLRHIATLWAAQRMRVSS